MRRLSTPGSMPTSLDEPWLTAPRHRPSAPRDAPAAPGRPGRLPVQGQALTRALRGEGEFDSQARRFALLEAGHTRGIRDARTDRGGRLRGDGNGGGGAAGRAEL